jgi:hypothetical protein
MLLDICLSITLWLGSSREGIDDDSAKIRYCALASDWITLRSIGHSVTLVSGSGRISRGQALMSEDGAARTGVIVAAMITALGTIIAAVITLSGGGASSSYNGGGGGNDFIGGGGGDPGGTQNVEFTVSIRSSPFQVQGGADVKVSIDSEMIGTIFTYQEPYQLRISDFAEGEHTYDLEITAYDTAGNVAWIKHGSDTISVQEGDNFQVLYDSSTDSVYLSPT